MLKSDNLQYNTLGRWVAGTNDSSTKRLMLQALFFISYRLRARKTLYFHFCKIMKNKLKRILQRILQEIMKTNNTWNIKRLVDESLVPATLRPSDPAYYVSY